jgi:hypothetical protein
MTFRSLSTGLILVGFALLGLAAFVFFRPADGPGVSIEAPEREFATVWTGHTIDVAFRVHNPTAHTAQVVGLTEC